MLATLVVGLDTAGWTFSDAGRCVRLDIVEFEAETGLPHHNSVSVSISSSRSLISTESPCGRASFLLLRLEVRCIFSASSSRSFLSDVALRSRVLEPSLRVGEDHFVFVRFCHFIHNQNEIVGMRLGPAQTDGQDLAVLREIDF